MSMTNQLEANTLDYRRWNESSDDELGVATTDKTVELHRYIAENGQSFNVLDVDARTVGESGEQEGPTIVGAISFDYRIDPLLTHKMSILAHHASARVLMSELPGVSVDHDDPFHTKGAWQTPAQTVAAFSGNFDPLALEQLRAVDSVAHFQDGDEIQLFGQSLGAYSVTAMTRVLANGSFEKALTVPKMTLFEPVNAYGNYYLINQLKMLKNLATTEDTRRQVYLDENAQIGHPMRAFEQLSDETLAIDKFVKSRPAQIIATYASGAGLRKGLHSALYDAMNNKTEDGPHLADAEIIVARATDSTVSHDEDLISLADAAHDAGGSVRLVKFSAGEGETTPLGHHSPDSLGRMADLALYLSR